MPSLLSTIRCTTLAGVVGLCMGSASPALARPDDRLLPAHDSLTVGLDDAIGAVQRAFPSADVLDAGLSRQGSRWVYMVKTLRGRTLRTVKFDVSTGDRLVNRRETVRGSRLDRLRQQARLLDSIATTKADAVRAAEAAVPGANAYEVELDDLNDRPVFKVKLLDGERRIVVLVSAADGTVQPMPGDGVVNISLDDAATVAGGLFPGWTLVRIELSDDRDFDDSGSFYHLRLVSADGTLRRDVKLNANTAGVRRDRTREVSASNAAEYALIASGAPAITFGAAAARAADSLAGARVHEVQLKFEDGLLVYEVELLTSDGLPIEVYVDAATGEVFPAGPVGGDPGNGGPANGALIGSDAATAIALARFPGAAVREVSTDTEHGVAVYEVSLIVPGGTRTDLKIDARTGAILRIDTDN